MKKNLEALREVAKSLGIDGVLVSLIRDDAHLEDVYDYANGTLKKNPLPPRTASKGRIKIFLYQFMLEMVAFDILEAPESEEKDLIQNITWFFDYEIFIWSIHEFIRRCPKAAHLYVDLSHLDPALDEKIEDIVGKRRDASGYSFFSGVRDLGFSIRGRNAREALEKARRIEKKVRRCKNVIGTSVVLFEPGDL